MNSRKVLVAVAVALSLLVISTRDLKAFYDKYAAASDQTGEAKYFMWRAASTCRLFIDRSVEDNQRAVASMGAPGHPVMKQRVDAVAAHGAQCRGFYKAPVGDPESLMREAIAKGYPAALAITLNDLDRSGRRDEASGKAIDLLKNADSEVMSRMLPYLQQRVWTPSNPPDAPPAELFADAWRLAACERGGDCGQDSRYLLERCYSGATCGSASLEEHFRGRAIRQESFRSLCAFEE